MSTQVRQDDSDDMRPEYDFSGAVRGKHFEAYRAGTNVVFLEPDLVVAFPDSASVTASQPRAAAHGIGQGFLRYRDHDLPGA
jgi:hypothetical protein